METVTDFIFLGSKITVEDDYSHEIKRHFLLGRKAVTNLDRILKSRDITLPKKACIVTSESSASDIEYLRRRLNAALAQLPPLVREAFSLFQISELSVREIARITGATENLVKVRVHRAKQKLRELLADMAS